MTIVSFSQTILYIISAIIFYVGWKEPVYYGWQGTSIALTLTIVHRRYSRKWRSYCRYEPLRVFYPTKRCFASNFSHLRVCMEPFQLSSSQRASPAGKEK